MGSPVLAFQKALQQLFLSSTSKHITPEFLEQVKPSRKTLSATEAQERAAEAQEFPKRPAVESRGPATIKNYGVKGVDPTTDPIRPRPQEVISPGKKQRPPSSSQHTEWEPSRLPKDAEDAIDDAIEAKDWETVKKLSEPRRLVPVPDEATRPIDTSEVIPVEGLSKSQARTEELRDILKEVGIEPRLNKPESFRARGSGEGFRPDALEAQRVTDVQTGKSFEDLSDQFAQADKEFYAENLSVPSGRALTKLRGRSPDRIVDTGGESDVGYGVGKVRVEGDKLNLTGEQQRANKELLEKTIDRIKIEGESPETRLSGDIRSEPGIVAKTKPTGKIDKKYETAVEREIDLAIRNAEGSRGSLEDPNIAVPGGPRDLTNRVMINKSQTVGKPGTADDVTYLMDDSDNLAILNEQLRRDVQALIDSAGGKSNIDRKTIEDYVTRRMQAFEADEAATGLQGKKPEPIDDFSTATEIEKRGGRERGIAVRKNTPPLTTTNLRQTMEQERLGRDIAGKPEVPVSQQKQQGQALRRLRKRFGGPAGVAATKSKRKQEPMPTKGNVSTDVSHIDAGNIEKFLQTAKPNSAELLRLQDELLGIAPEQPQLPFEHLKRVGGADPIDPSTELTMFQQQLRRIQDQESTLAPTESKLPHLVPRTKFKITKEKDPKSPEAKVRRQLEQQIVAEDKLNELTSQGIRKGAGQPSTGDPVTKRRLPTTFDPKGGYVPSTKQLELFSDDELMALDQRLRVETPAGAPGDVYVFDASTGTYKARPPKWTAKSYQEHTDEFLKSIRDSQNVPDKPPASAKLEQARDIDKDAGKVRPELEIDPNQLSPEDAAQLRLNLDAELEKRQLWQPDVVAPRRGPKATRAEKRRVGLERQSKGQK